MHAITIREPGGPEVLEWAESPDPEPGPGEVLIEIAAASVNRPDVMQRRGMYAPPPGASSVPGLDCSGTIAALGAGVTGFRVGEQVCALLAGGGYAERVTVPAEQVLPIPAGVDLVTAAAFPEAAITAWSNVVMIAGLRPGETLLVHGGGSGVGTFAAQIGKALGATVAATVGSDERVRACREVGVDIPINYREQDFVAELKTATDGHGADVVLDHLGASYLDRNIAALAMGGRLVVIGLMGGAKVEFNLGSLMQKRASVTGTLLRPRPVTGPGGKAEIVADVRARLWPLVADGLVRPIVHTILPVQQAAEAHRMLEAGEVFGKVILTVR